MTSPILNELLQRTTALRSLARELVGDAHADDIVQETAIQSMIAPPKHPGPAGNWLAGVVRNLASKHRRAERTRTRHEATVACEEVVPSDRGAEDADTLRRLTEIVTSLPEPYRGTILARYLREQTPSEIAAATDTPVRTVKTRLQRGLALLRQRLDERGGDWRALFVGVFELKPTVASKGTSLVGTTMKLSLLAAVLLPVGFTIWINLPDGAPPTGITPVSGGVVAQGLTGGSVEPIEPDASQATLAPGRDAPATVAALSQQGSELPADRPLVRFDTVGPAALRAAFLPTNIGSLVATEEGEQLWRPLLAPLEGIWRQLDGGDEFEATRQRVLDYAGRIRVFWMVDPGEGSEPDSVFGVFALETDGATDLTALADDASRVMMAAMAEEPTEWTVGDHSLRMLGSAGDQFVTLPLLIEGNLVAFFGAAAALENTVPRCLRALAMDDAQPTAPLSLEIDLTQLKGLAEMRSEPPLAKALGLESLRSLQATVGPDGGHAQLQVDVVFGEGDRGLMAAFLPAVDTLPALLARVPAEATPWVTLPFRPDVLFQVVVDSAAEINRVRGNETQGVRQELYDELGVYLDTELLDHVGGDVMVLGDLWQSDDPEVYRRGDDPPLGACIALSLEDAAAFGEGSPQASRPSEGHRQSIRGS